MLNLGRWLGFGHKPPPEAGKRRADDRHSVSPRTNALVRVVVITADDRFHSFVRDIAATGEWTVFRALTIEQALAILRSESVPLVIYDGDTADTHWREAIERLTKSQPGLCVMLASTVADEYLRSEVLRHRGYDILPRSADREQMVRALQFAWFWTTRSRM